MKFSKEVTNVCKGIAVLLLLCHHTFTGNNERIFVLKPYVINDTNVTVSIGVLGKLCVAMFLVLSGYGLYKKFTSDGQWEQNTSRFVINSLIKLLVIYQFIYLLALPVNIVVGRSITLMYGDKVPLINIIVDFFGLSYLFKFLQMNPTMWYMSIAIVSVLLFPFLKKSVDRFGITPLVLVAWLAHGVSDEIIYYFGVFISGIILAKYDLFMKMKQLKIFGCHEKIGTAIKFILFTVIIIMLIQLRLLVAHMDYLIAPFLIYYIFCYFFSIPIVTQVLGFLGKHSGNIFMTHSYFLILCPQLIYWTSSPALAVLTLLVGSLLTSFLVVGLFKLLQVNRLQKYLIERYGSPISAQQTTE